MADYIDIIKNKMIELSNVDLNEDLLFKINENAIKMYNVYNEDNTLYELLNPENDWVREFMSDDLFINND
jgi:hypothetical protein